MSATEINPARVLFLEVYRRRKRPKARKEKAVTARDSLLDFSEYTNPNQVPLIGAIAWAGTD